MAIIGTLRSKMGTWVVVFVFVAITAFILGDLFSGNSSILSWGRNSVGEIGGKEISNEEYQTAIQEQENNYRLNFGREPGEREMLGIRQQAWDLLVARYAVFPEFQKVGVTVTQDEVVDMIIGKNIDENVKNAFTNQQTGEFDRSRISSYLRELKTPPNTEDQQALAMWQEQKIRWDIFEKNLKPSRERIKYENLLLKSNYVTTAEAEREYHVQTDVAEVKYVYVPYYAISDSSAKVSDSDLSAYYNKNKERYKTEAIRDIKYVSIPVSPSATDSAAVKQDLERDVAEFKNAAEDSVYASSRSEGENPYGKYNLGSLPAFVNKDDLTQGNVIGPFLDGNIYKIVKVSKITTDTVYSARARHILIKAADNSDAAKAAAKEQARTILKDIKGGADFAAKAMQFGTDGTKQRGGDLGWFSAGAMVKPFENAVFSATKTGVLADVVETDFGYHIIDVTNTKTNAAYELAIIEREIAASDATINEAYRKAETFANDLSGVSDFEERAKEQGFTVLEANNISAGDRRIGTIGEARQIVQWLFRDASKGKVSQFDLQDQNVIVVMTGEISKGYKPLSMVKDEITPAVRNEIKGKQIVEKLNGLASKGTLEEVATGFGTDASVHTSSDLKLSSNALPSAGFDPQAVGLAFSLENGKRSKAFAGENGVVLIEMLNKTIAPEITDFSVYKNQLEQGVQGRVGYTIGEALKDKADIVDKRYKFNY